MDRAARLTPWKSNVLASTDNALSTAVYVKTSRSSLDSSKDDYVEENAVREPGARFIKTELASGLFKDQLADQDINTPYILETEKTNRGFSVILMSFLA